MSTRPSLLAEQVARAQATIATWSPEKLASMQLQGTDPFHERLAREKAADGRAMAALPLGRAAARRLESASAAAEGLDLGRLAFERMQALSPPFGGPLGWMDIGDRTRNMWSDVAGTIAAAALAANDAQRHRGG